MTLKNLLYLCSLVTLLVSSPAYPLKLTPSNFELRPKGSGSNYVFEVGNDSNQIIAVEVNIYTRALDENGVEINLETSSLFEVYPSQLILPENSTKKMRVRWTGDANINVEQAFRLKVTQLPVSFSKNTDDSSVKVLHSVIGALYVSPRSVSSKLVVEKAEKRGERLSFVVRESGGKHSLLSEYEVVVQGDSEVVIDPIEFSKLTTQNVLPLSRLIVDIPWPKSAGRTLKSVTIK